MKERLSSQRPLIIQGSMSIGIAGWKLARAVAQAGHLGIIAGFALEEVFFRRLQQGDPDGALHRALACFPHSAQSQFLVDTYETPKVTSRQEPFQSMPGTWYPPSRERQLLTVMAHFSEVWLAKENHAGLIGINYLEMNGPCFPAALYGALLAHVDYLIVRRSMLTALLNILEPLRHYAPVTWPVGPIGTFHASDVIAFDPRILPLKSTRPLPTPQSFLLTSIEKLSDLNEEGLPACVEGLILTQSPHTHPRHVMDVDSSASTRPQALHALSQQKIPFFLSGSYGSPEKLQTALSLGASGIQVASLFLCCDESALHAFLKTQLLQTILKNQIEFFEDPWASPISIPLQWIALENTLSDPQLYFERSRICDLPYFQIPYSTPEERLQWRCPSEPLEPYLKKGGSIHDTHHRQCLCNAFLANLGLGQIRNGKIEKPLITAGPTLTHLAHFLKSGSLSYTAQTVLDYLLSSSTPNTNTRDPIQI